MTERFTELKTMGFKGKLPSDIRGVRVLGVVLCTGPRC